MVRITKLIGKTDIFNIVLNPLVAKIEILNSENKTLSNPNVCRVHIYLRMPINDIHTIMANCKNAIIHYKDWEKTNKGFVTGLRSTVQNGFVKWSQLQKLEAIGKEEGINFKIPKYIENLVTKFEHYKNG